MIWHTQEGTTLKGQSSTVSSGPVYSPGALYLGYRSSTAAQGFESSTAQGLYAKKAEEAITR